MRGLSKEGNLRFKIDWASLIVGSKFTVFALFYFAFEGNFPSTSPRGGLIWRGDLTEGFFALPAWGAYIWRGLFPEFYGILKGISENDCEFERSFCSQVRFRRKLYLEKEKLEIVLICTNCKR